MNRAKDWSPSLWMDVFEELLYDDNELDYGDQWSLTFNYNQSDKVTKEERKRGWRIYCHSLYGTFQCGNCYKSWRSARVVVLFRYRLRGDRGTVIMRPFGQACRSCPEDVFELPGFSKKGVEETLLRLCGKIRKNCYGEEDEDDEDDDGDSSVSTKVFTRPHEASLCEACLLGICCQDED